jgi:hypothetical protein
VNRDYALLALLRLAIERLNPPAVRAGFCVPVFFTKEGRLANFEFASNLNMRLPIRFWDASGTEVPAPAGGAVSVDDPNVAIASMEDNSTVLLVSVGAGESVLRYSNPNFPNLQVEALPFGITASGVGGSGDGGSGSGLGVPVRAGFDTANAVPVPKV